MCAAVDVHYPRNGGARAAAVLAADAAVAHLLSGRTAVLPRVPLYRPGEFCLREFPPLRAVLDSRDGLGLLVAGGYVGLDPGRPSRPGRVCAWRVRRPGDRGGQVPVPRGHRAVPVRRGSSPRPLFVTAAGIPAAGAADLVRHLTGRCRLPGAGLRRRTRDGRGNGAVP